MLLTFALAAVVPATGAPATGAPERGAPASQPAGSSAPIYYGFKHSDGSGCGPQVFFIKVVGTTVYEVGRLGCDGWQLKGTIKGAKLRRTLVVDTCQDGTKPAPIVTVDRITGGPTNLRIAGVKRVVGPTPSIRDLQTWWNKADARSKHPEGPDANHVRKQFAEAARSNWVTPCF